jgi:hypothetical protein
LSRSLKRATRAEKVTELYERGVQLSRFYTRLEEAESTDLNERATSRGAIFSKDEERK